MIDALPARFWNRVNRNGSLIVTDLGRCWEWTGSRVASGYGRFWIDGHEIRAHRLMAITVGMSVGGLEVCHRCDNPPCCNPEHLFVGTRLENARDMSAKGRGPVGIKSGSYTHPETRRRGILNGRSKLTDLQVLEIRRRWAAGESCRNLAEEFGISNQLVSQIGLLQVWRHVA